MNLRLPILAPLKLVSEMALASAHGSDTGVITNVNTADNILVTASATHGTRQSISTTAITGLESLHLVKASAVPNRCTSQLWSTFLHVLTLADIATHCTSASERILSPTGVPSSKLPMQKLQVLPITARTIGRHITHSLHTNRMHIHEIPRIKALL
jgi:hypothetical protein